MRIPVETDTISETINQFFILLEKDDIGKAQKILTTLLDPHDLEKHATLAQRERVAQSYHRLATPLLNLSNGIPLVKDLYKKFEACCATLMPTTQITFYLHQGDMYFNRMAHETLFSNIQLLAEEAAKAYARGLWVIEREESDQEEPFSQRLHQLQAYFQATLVIAAQADRNIPTYLDAHFYEISDLFTRLQPLLETLYDHNQRQHLNALYQQLQPYLKKFTTDLGHALHRAYANSLEAFTQIVQTAEPLVKLWHKHRQYDSVEQVYHLILTKAKGKAESFNRDVIRQRYNEVNSIIERRKQDPSFSAPEPIEKIALPTHKIRKQIITIRRSFLTAVAKNCAMMPLAQRNYTQAILKLLRELLHEAERLLGPAPCEFRVLGLGSFARDELTVGSDLDIAWLIADEKHRRGFYFQYFIQLFQWQLMCLGEGEEGFLLMDGGCLGSLLTSKSEIKSTTSTPSPPPLLLNSPDGFATDFAFPGQYVDSDKFYSLYRARLLYQSQTKEKTPTPLLQSLRKKLFDSLNATAQKTPNPVDLGLEKPAESVSPNKMEAKEESTTTTDHSAAIIPETEIPPKSFQSLAIRHLNTSLQQYLNTAKKPLTLISIKERYLSPLIYLCSDLALFYELIDDQKRWIHSLPKVVAQLQRRSIFSMSFSRELIEAWQTLQHLRTQLHASWRRHRWHSAHKREEMYFPEAQSIPIATPTEFILNAEQIRELTWIDCYLLQPFYQAIDNWLKSNPEYPKNPPKMPLQEVIYDPVVFLAKEACHDSALSSTSKEALDKMLTLYQKRHTPVSMYLSFYAPLSDKLKTQFYLQLIDTLRQREEAVPSQLSILISEYADLPKPHSIIWPSPPDPTPVKVLLNNVGSYPSSEGFRPFYAESQHTWQHTLETITDPLPAEATKDWSQISNRFVMQWLNPSARIITRVLKESIQNAWQKQGYFDDKGTLQPKSAIAWSTASTDGRGRVIPLFLDTKTPIAYIKWDPEMPGVHALAESAAWRISGDGPLTTLVKLTHTSTGAFYPALFSQTAGETLQSLLRRTGGLKTVESQLDPTHFTLKVIETLLLLYEDDKLDNIAFRLFPTPQGLAYRLISFDCDRAFVEPLLKRESIRKTEIKVNVKSLIFCLDQMMEPLDSKAINMFLALDPLLVLREWLKTQDRLTQGYTTKTGSAKSGLFTTLELLQLADAKPDGIYIHAALSDQTIKKMYQRLIRLQSLLRGDSLPANHRELFNFMEPALSSYYDAVWDQHSTASERFHALPTDYIVIEEKPMSLGEKEDELAAAEALASTSATNISAKDSPISSKSKSAAPKSAVEIKASISAPVRYHKTTGLASEHMRKTITLPHAKDIKALKEAIIKGCFRTPGSALEFELEPTHKAYQLRDFIRGQLQQGNLQPFSELKSYDYFREQVLMDLDWQTLKVSVQKEFVALWEGRTYQKELLTLMEGGNYYRLYFLNSEALTDDRLIAILKSCPELSALQITGCCNLTESIWAELSRLCPYLEKLEAQQLEKLTQITALNFFNNPNGPLKFLKLRRLWLDDCRNLSLLHIEAPQLETLSISGCDQLKTVSLVGLPEGFEMAWEPKLLFDELKAEVTARFESKNPTSTELKDSFREQELLLPFLRGRYARAKQPLTKMAFWEDWLQRWLNRSLKNLQKTQSNIILKTIAKAFWKDLKIIAQTMMKQKTLTIATLPRIELPIAIANLLLHPLCMTEYSNYRFLHPDLLIYLMSCNILELLQQSITQTQIASSFPPTLLFEEITDLISEFVTYNPTLQKHLWQWVESSKTNAAVATIAAYAITLLNRAGVVWMKKNLSGIRIPGADLRGAVLSGADLSYADLSRVCLVDAWLAEANLSHAHLAGVWWKPDRSINLQLPLKTHAGGVYALSYRSDGRQLASVGSNSDQTVRLWEVASGRAERVLKGYTRETFVLSYSPDGYQLASGSDDEIVRLWEVRTGREQRALKGHTGLVTALCYRQDGQQLASGSLDCSVRLWDVRSGREERVLKGHARAVNALTYHPEGQQLASGGEDRTIRLWMIGSGREERVLRGHTDWVVALSYCPDGRQLASGANDHTVRLWTVVNGREERVLKGHKYSVDVLSYRPDGRQLASGSDDSVRLWEVRTGICLLILNQFKLSLRSLSWLMTAGRFFLATGCDDQTVRQWQLDESGPVPRFLLCWSRPSLGLNFTEVQITQARGLTAGDIKFFKEQGAIGEPKAPDPIVTTQDQAIHTRNPW